MNVKTQRSGQTPSVNGRPANAKRKPRPETAVTPAPQPASHRWIWAGFGIALLAGLIAYGPALRGGFVFDDVHMHFAGPHPDNFSLVEWVRGARPLTDFSYWVNYQMGGTDPLGYHLTNILLHAIRLADGVSDRAQSTGNWRRSICGAEPSQPGSVARFFCFIRCKPRLSRTSPARSESLSVALAFAAWACFLYRPSSAISLRRALLVLLLFGVAVGGKEHVAVASPGAIADRLLLESRFLVRGCAAQLAPLRAIGAAGGDSCSLPLFLSGP